MISRNCLFSSLPPDLLMFPTRELLHQVGRTRPLSSSRINCPFSTAGDQKTIKSTNIAHKRKRYKFSNITPKYTLLETNISPEKSILKMIFLFPRWDMLIPWRVTPKVYQNAWKNISLEDEFPVCVHSRGQLLPPGIGRFLCKEVSQC